MKLLLALTIALIEVTHIAAVTTSVSAANFAFSPTPVTIAVGDSVEWTTLSSQAPHSVAQTTSSFDGYDGSGFHSGSPGAVDTYTHQFNTAGTYYYMCEEHPFMHGQIIVEAAAPTTAAAVPTTAAAVPTTAAAVPTTAAAVPTTAAAVPTTVAAVPTTAAAVPTTAAAVPTTAAAVPTTAAAVPTTVAAVPTTAAAVPTTAAAVPTTAAAVPTTAAAVPTTAAAVPTTAAAVPTTAAAVPTTAAAEPTTAAVSPAPTTPITGQPPQATAQPAEPTTAAPAATTPMPPAGTPAPAPCSAGPAPARAEDYCSVHKHWERSAALGQQDWPAVTTESLVIVLRRGHGVYAYQMDDGTEAWSVLDSNVQGSVAVDGEYCVFGTNGHVYIVNVTSGATIHSVVLTAYFGHINAHGAPVIYDDVAYVVQALGRVTAVNVSTGAVWWTRSLGLNSGAYAPVSLWNGSIVIGTFDGRVVQLDKESGDVIGNVELPGYPLWRPGPLRGIVTGVAIYDDWAFFSSSQITSNFFKLDLVNMSIVDVMTPAPGYFAYTTPTIYNGILYTTTSNGDLHAICPETFDITWSFSTRSYINTYGPILIGNDVAILMVSYGWIYEIDVASHLTLRPRKFLGITYGNFAAQLSWSGSSLIAAGGLSIGVFNTSCTL